MHKTFLLLGVLLISSCSSTPKEQIDDIFKKYHSDYKYCLQGQDAKVLFRVRLLPNGNTWEKKSSTKQKCFKRQNPV